MTDALVWERAKPADEARVRAFLEPRESWACACSGRLKAATGAFALPPIGKGGLYLLAEKASATVRSLVLFSSTGTALPVFDSPLPSRVEPGVVASNGLHEPQLEACLRKLRTAPLFVLWKPDAAIGLSSHVGLLERSFEWKPTLRIAYDMMALECEREASPPDSRCPSGLVIRQATVDDLESLMPLAMAYDQDEVLTPLHRFDYDACKASQVRSLARYRVFVAILDGQVVGRAQTNATGYSREQLAGIFFKPERRGSGIASVLVGAIADAILASGKRPCLFVKKSNAPARRVYEKLGFEAVSDFSVDYFG